MDIPLLRRRNARSARKRREAPAEASRGGGLCLLAAIGLFAAGWHFLASFFVPLGILFAIVSVACFTLAEVRSDEKPAPVSLKKD